MYMLDSKWPSIQKVTGIDLSTFKLAVCEEKKSMMVRVCVYACDCAWMCVYFDVFFRLMIIFNVTDLRAYHLPCTLPSTPTYFLTFHYFFFSIFNILFSSTPLFLF